MLNLIIVWWVVRVAGSFRRKARWGGLLIFGVSGVREVEETCNF
jgi:hypothetical protein